MGKFTSPKSLKTWLTSVAVEAPECPLWGITVDSRAVREGWAFLAINGHRCDGRAFIGDAIERGAAAILKQVDDAKQHGTVESMDAVIVVSFYDLSKHLSLLAAAFFDFPSASLHAVAVTGTNGKTSVVNMIAQLWHAQGQQCAVMGTLGNGVYGAAEGLADTQNTTPDAISVQGLLHQWQQQAVPFVAFEASSHALVQGRISHVNTQVAVFTNLTRDHLDYHGTMQAYADAKRQLLSQPGLEAVVLNANDEESLEWAKRAGHCAVVWTSCGATTIKPEQFCIAQKITFTSEGCEFRLDSHWGTGQVKLPLLGEFNVSNALEAFAAVMLQGGEFDRALTALASLKPVPGRMELFRAKNAASPVIVVDYAHTPDALKQLLQNARRHAGGKLWCVFGCGGDRDKGKRPLMGQIAEAMADVVVLTTDNSRSESPASIVQDIIAGMRAPAKAINIPSREQALRYCLLHAAPNDMVLMAGKGHETYQSIQQHIIEYDERATVGRVLEEFSQ